MRLALVFPPLTDPTQPYSSLPALAAVARRAGHEVSLLDANVGFVGSLLTAPAVRRAGRRLQRLLSRRGDGPAAAQDAPSARVVRAYLRASGVAAGIEEAVDDLRRADTFRDLARLAAAQRLVDEALDVHAAGWPAGLGFGAAETPELTWPRQVIARASRRRRNPFFGYLRRVTVEELKRASPQAIGLSVTYRSQVLPAVTLALLCKRWLPGVPVILGGSMVSRWYDGIEAAPEIFACCDHLVAFEGESALVGLLAVFEGGGDLDAVPNLVFRRDGRVVKTATACEDVDSLPTPDYDGLPLDAYLAPRPVFLLATSRGCYWRRCSFCSVSPSTRARYRTRRPDLVQADMATLVARHGTRCISLADDCVSPSTLRALAALLRRRGPRVSWQCETRFERALDSELLEELAAAGCRNLIFGLESYSPRVLALMDKGVRHADVARILAGCRRAGIAFNLQFFFGFPGETAEDAAATEEFVAGQMHGAATFSFGLFELQKGALVELQPGRFGIRRVERRHGPLAVRYDYAPVPEHAAACRARLRRRLGERVRHPHAGLSINAHTLLFLDEAGVAELGGLYCDEAGAVETARPSAPAAALLERPLRRGVRQQALELARLPPELAGELGADGDGGVLLYDHDLDRTVLVPRLALWLLDRLDGRTTASQLALRLAQEAGAERQTAGAAVARLVGELAWRGFLRAEG